MGVPESTPQLFGNSWKTLSACVPLAPGSLLDPCDVHLQAGEEWGPGEAWGGRVEVNCFERGEKQPEVGVPVKHIGVIEGEAAGRGQEGTKARWVGSFLLCHCR